VRAVAGAVERLGCRALAGTGRESARGATWLGWRAERQWCGQMMRRRAGERSVRMQTALACGLEYAQAAGRANAGRTARERGGRWRRGWRRAREWLGRSRSSMRTARGVREQERAGMGVDAARVGGVTLTREWHTSQAALERFAGGVRANLSDAEQVTRACAR
jgi:hypothetical protein